MVKGASTEYPKVELATKDWVVSELRDTEGRIEKAFHEQARFFNEKFDRWKQEFDRQISMHRADTDKKILLMEDRHHIILRWVIGLILTSNITLMVAILLK
jgi:hypothetical protein